MRHWFFLWKAGSGGGVCPVGRLLTLPLWYPAGVLAFFVARLPFYFSLLSCPPSPKEKDIPPTPFPSGEGGDLRLFYARGSAPCIPGAGRGAALAEPAVQETEGGRSGFGRLPTLPLWYPAGSLPSLLPACLFTLAYFPAPIPPAPFPAGRGRILLYFAGGGAPGTPATGWDAALAQLSVTRIESPAFCHRCKGFWLSLSMSSAVSQGEGGPGERNFGV